MLKALLILFLTAILWAAVLWFGIKPEFAQWSHLGVLSVHLLPPLAVLVGWLAFLRHRRARSAADAAEREAKAEAERLAKLDAARREHEAETQRLRYGCDCRALAVSQLLATKSDTALFEAGDVLSYSRQNPEPAEELHDDLRCFFRPAIHETLSALYTACPGALAFPILVAPPAQLGGEEVFGDIRAIHAQLAEELGKDPEFVKPVIRFLPLADGVANRVIPMFENDDQLVAAVLLGFDSPWMDAKRDDEDEEASGQPLLGNPAQAVVGVLMTHQALPAILAAMPSVDPGSEGEEASMVPYWQRTTLPAGTPEVLARLSPEERTILAELPVLARVHRAASIQLGPPKNRGQEIIRLIRSTLERAQVKAGLVERPFDCADTAEGDSKAPACGWLVHNAGGVAVSGHRLAALGSAMYQQGIEVDPIDAATNLVVEIGDCGRAFPLLQLAATIVQASTNAAPALCAEFSGDDGLAVFFARPIA